MGPKDPADHLFHNLNFITYAPTMLIFSSFCPCVYVCLSAQKNWKTAGQTITKGCEGRDDSECGNTVCGLGPW